jgi:gliding motility-associated lipoprotein GldH
MKIKLLSFCLLFAVACTDSKTILDDYESLSDDQWLSKNKLEFPFEVSNNKVSYALFYQVRYNKEYPFHNLYIKRHLLDSTGKNISSILQGMYLFDEKTGYPKGGGWGNNFDYQILSDSNVKFPYNGNYTIVLEQYMRIDTIPGLSHVGVKVGMNQ